MRKRLEAVAGLLVLGGCASLGEQIQHQQEIIQRCDIIQDSPQLPNWQVGERYLLERNAQGAIVIERIRPHGNQLANDSIVDLAADRTVAITLEIR